MARPKKPRAPRVRAPAVPRVGKARPIREYTDEAIEGGVRDMGRLAQLAFRRGRADREDLLGGLRRFTTERERRKAAGAWSVPPKKRKPRKR